MLFYYILSHDIAYFLKKSQKSMCACQYFVPLCVCVCVNYSFEALTMYIFEALNMYIFTGRNEVLAKVIFLHLSVIHSVHRGGGGLQFFGGSPIFRGGFFFLISSVFGDTTPPPGTRHWNTVNVRPVRILLECILVLFNSIHSDRLCKLG